MSSSLEVQEDIKCLGILLNMQRACGKKFITDEEVDDLVRDVIKEVENDI